MSHYFLCSQNKHSKNRRFFQCMVSDFVAANFSKKESRSPRGFLPRPLPPAGESEFRTPPPFPQKNEAGCGQEFRSKKVRANAKITPPNDNFDQQNTDLVRRLGLIWQFQILFLSHMGFPRGRLVSGTSAVGAVQGQTTVGQGRL